MVVAPWRLNLQPASFNGAEFHVDVSTRNGGRRNAVHEFPKKNIPYTEDMGRRVRMFNVVGYVIGPDFEDARDALIEQLESDNNGTLVLPTSFDQKIVICDRFSLTERREQGGFAQFEMVFLEAGQDPSVQGTSTDTSAVSTNTSNSVTGSASSFNDLGDTFINSNDITGLS